MNRRSFFAFLGLAPAVVPVALKVAEPARAAEILSREFPQEFKFCDSAVYFVPRSEGWITFAHL